MTEYEYLFVTCLHSKLKEAIDARIYVKVTKEDQLYVEIEKVGLKYACYLIDNFSRRLCEGLSAEEAYHKAHNKYRAFIIRTFFY